MPDNCQKDCPVLPRVEALEEANKQHWKSHEGIYDRLRTLERSDAVQDANYAAIDAKLDELTIMVKDLSGKSGKRWDGLVDKLIYAAALAVVAWVAAGAPGLGT